MPLIQSASGGVCRSPRSGERDPQRDAEGPTPRPFDQHLLAGDDGGVEPVLFLTWDGRGVLTLQQLLAASRATVFLGWTYVVL